MKDTYKKRHCRDIAADTPSLSRILICFRIR